MRLQGVTSDFLSVSASFSAMIVACLALIVTLLGDDMFDRLALQERHEDGVLRSLGRPFLKLSAAWVISMVCYSGVLLCQEGSFCLARTFFIIGTTAAAYCLQGVVLMTWLCLSVFQTKAMWVKTLKEDSPTLVRSTTDQLKRLLAEAKLALEAGAPTAATSVCFLFLSTLCDEMSVPTDMDLSSRVAHLERKGVIRADMVVRLQHLLGKPIHETSQLTAELLVQEISTLLSQLVG